MSAPLSVNLSQKTQVEVNESCHCCIPFRQIKKDNNVVILTDEVYHRTTIQVKRYSPPNKLQIPKPSAPNGTESGIKK